MIGSIGAQVGLLLWGVAVWTPKREPKEWKAFGEIQLMAAFGAVGLSAIATIPVLISLFTDSERGLRILAIYPAYFIGCALAGTVLWLFQRIQHLASGRYLGGVLAAACLHGAVAPVVALLKASEMSLGEGALLALACGGLMGPALAFDKDLF